MRGTILYGPRDVRFEECDVPRLIKPTDAIIGISATCVCGSVNVLERKRADEALRQTLEEVHRLRDRLQMENVYLREQLRRDGPANGG